MKLKSMILASAASLFAVNGAVAADAIVAVDPEPVNYVEICDAYGAGFFFIPGTEVCLDISGRVRVQYAYNSVREDFEVDNDFRIDFDARHESDFGTVKSFVRIGNSSITGRGFSQTFATENGGAPGPGNAVVGVNTTLDDSIRVERAYISIMPTDSLEIIMGRAGSFYYAEEVDAQLIGVKYAAGGFTAALSYEDRTLSGVSGQAFGAADDAIILALGYSFGAFSVYAEGAFEGEEVGNQNTYAARVGGAYKNDRFSVGLEYEWFDGPSAFEVVSGPAGNEDELSINLGLTLNDKWSAASNFDVYFDNQGWAVENTITYAASSNFSVAAELDYASEDAVAGNDGVWQLGLDFVATF